MTVDASIRINSEVDRNMCDSTSMCKTMTQNLLQKQTKSQKVECFLLAKSITQPECN